MITAEGAIPGSLTIISLGYRARCTEAGCKNLARMILRYADAGGRPMSNSEFCHAHARVRVPRDQAAGLKVYDDREIPLNRRLVEIPTRRETDGIWCGL